MQPILILIPTCRRLRLLDRTLSYLSAATLPTLLEGVIVLENGEQSGAQEVLEKFRDRLPVQRFAPRPNKSAALNQVLAEATNQFIIFFDDDVRVHPDTLTAYEHGVAAQGHDAFFGGRCLVDYEQEPQEWLKRYFPRRQEAGIWGPRVLTLPGPGALGFQLGRICRPLESGRRVPTSTVDPELVCWATKPFSNVISCKKVLRYTICRMLSYGILFPSERCSPEWCLERVPSRARAAGHLMRHKPSPQRAWSEIVYSCKLLGMRTLLAALGRRMNGATHFHYDFWLRWYRGLLQGLRDTTSAGGPPRL